MMTLNDAALPDAHLTGRRAGLFMAALFLVMVIAQVDRVLPFILAEAIKADLSLSDTQVGLLTGVAFAACYALLSLPLARLSDRGSPRRVLVLCMLAWSATTALGGIATGFLFLALTRFGVAFGEAAAIPSSHALIARRIGPERRGTAIGIFSLGIPVGAMLGFGLGGTASDVLGWRWTLMGAGLLGAIVAVVVTLATGPTPPLPDTDVRQQPYMRASLTLLSSPVFRWLFAGAVMTGFASAPFYAFATPFLIRTHGFTATEAGAAFGLLQGALGAAGTLAGGRGFDRAVRIGRGFLRVPGLALLAASATTFAALMIPNGSLVLALMAPAMLGFTLMIPYAFGSAHLVAGPGREAMASSLAMIGTGLFGPALGPLLVGLISDSVGDTSGLALGLMVVPAASLVAGLIFLLADRKITELRRL
jgi:predicted MFS family arabinose efflux permease